MSLFPHAFVPCGRSLTGTSIDELIRPGLCRAYPLPDDDGHGRFQHLLEALARLPVDPGGMERTHG